MCGVAAIAGTDHATRDVGRLLLSMRHRGPDGSGVATTVGGAVGMGRLRIRPPRTLALPFQVGTRAVAYNGEVYADGRADGATATVADELGALFRDRDGSIDGMWAAAWTDGGSLMLERDRWGQRPLYYRRVGDGWAAASEASALLRVFGRPELSSDALVEMLALGAPITASTVFHNIHAVPPGALLRLTPGRDGAALVVRRDNGDGERGALRHHGQLPDALDRAVVRCLVADRPVGLAVSGGLDSTLVAERMLRQGLPDVVTANVSVAADDVGDLSRFVDWLTPRARELGWRHVSTTVDRYRYLNLLAESVNAMGFPTRMSSVPMYLALARIAASADVVVMLTGEGADELFLGYDSYRRYFADPGEPEITRLERVHLPERRQALLRRLFGDAPVRRCREAYRDLAYRAFHARSVLRRIERMLSLTPLLERADVCLMASGIEGRAPFLHADVPAHAAAFDDVELSSCRLGKTPLRTMDGGRLDYHLRHVPKRPFRAPLRGWLCEDDTRWRSTVRARARRAARTLDLRAGAVDIVVDEAHEDEEAATLLGALLAVDSCEFI